MPAQSSSYVAFCQTPSFRTHLILEEHGKRQICPGIHYFRYIRGSVLQLLFGPRTHPPYMDYWNLFPVDDHPLEVDCYYYQHSLLVCCRIFSKKALALACIGTCGSALHYLRSAVLATFPIKWLIPIGCHGFSQTVGNSAGSRSIHFLHHVLLVQAKMSTTHNHYHCNYKMSPLFDHCILSYKISPFQFPKTVQNPSQSFFGTYAYFEEANFELQQHATYK